MPSLITKDQTRVLRTLAARTLGACSCPKNRTERAVGQCDFHDWLADGFGVASTLSLSFAQADRAIAHLKGLAPERTAVAPRRTTPPRYTVPVAAGMITQAQATRLGEIEDQLGWLCERPGVPSPRLQDMARRQFGLPANTSILLSALRNRQASSLITGLSRLLDHQRRTA